MAGERDNIIDFAKERRRRGPRFTGALMDILEVSRDLVCVCRKGRITAINGAGVRLLGGKSSEELIGRKLSDFLIPEYGEVLELFLSGKASEDKAVPTRLVGIDDMTCDVEMQVFPAREIAPDAAVVVCRDISREGRLAGQAQETDARFSLLVENAMNLVCHVRGGHIRYVNRAGVALLGLSSAADLVGQPIGAIFQSEYASVFEDDLLAGIVSERSGVPMRLRRPDGQWVDAMVAVTRLPSHGPEELMVEARDIGPLNRAVTALRGAHETLEMRVAHRTRELAGQQALAEEHKHIADAARHFTESVLEAIPSPMWFKDATVGVIGVISDISERKHMERELRRLATIDSLTGAANRRHFIDLSRQELDRAARYGHPVSVLMLDIDHFKRINDTHGHAIGDEALKALTATCAANLRECDILGRLGGEEFALLLPETLSSGAVEVAERLRKAVSEIRMPLPQGGVLGFTASLGVVTRMDTDAGLDAMLARADEALYRAKQQGRNRVEFA